MEAIQKSLKQKILLLMKAEVLPMFPNRISIALDVAECRVSTCLNDLMLDDKVQLSAEGGYCLMGWSAKKLSAAESEKRATVRVDNRYELIAKRDFHKNAAAECSKELLSSYKDNHIRADTGITPDALRRLVAKRIP